MTNVHGRDYGTHIDGVEGRTLCKRYAQPDVNRVGPGEEEQASCKLCQRAWQKAQQTLVLELRAKPQ